jgi:4-hydroxymandelate oxidase
MAVQQLAHDDGEVATARAAQATGAGMILSTLSNRTIEAVRAGTTGSLWFQLLMYRDLLNGFHVPSDIPVPNLDVDIRDTLASQQSTASALGTFIERFWDASIAWRDLAWLQSITTLPILVKRVVLGDGVLMVDGGIRRGTDVLKAECDLAFAVAGCRIPADVTRDLIAFPA